MAVLTNGNTASASELFACALRDYNKAILVGTKTYGKGSMQTIYMLPDGTGLRLTTNKYNPPKSGNYDGVGLTPDIEVALSEALKGKSHFEYTDSEDNQLQSAVSGMKNS
jgi:carboxyl-terminal processing protease